MVDRGGGLETAQLRQLRGQVVGVDLFVRRVFRLHLPADGRGRWRADEEQATRVRALKVSHLALVTDGCGFTEVTFRHAFVQECRAVDGLSHGDAGVDIVERADDAVHRFQRRERVQWCDTGDVCPDQSQGLSLEDLRVTEACDQEGVGWWSGLLERWDVGEVDR